LGGPGDVSVGSKAVILKIDNDFRSSPNNRHVTTASACPKGATKRRKSRKIRDSEADISRPGNRNCGFAHEVAGDNQQQRMPAVAYRYAFGGGVASAF
jgi:hypothetical protein